MLALVNPAKGRKASQNAGSVMAQRGAIPFPNQMCYNILTIQGGEYMSRPASGREVLESAKECLMKAR